MINSSTRKVLIFFTSICMMLLMQTLFQFSRVLRSIFSSEPYRSHANRLMDVIFVLVQISTVMMFVGVTLAIKRA